MIKTYVFKVYNNEFGDGIQEATAPDESTARAEIKRRWPVSRWPGMEVQEVVMTYTPVEKPDDQRGH